MKALFLETGSTLNMLIFFGERERRDMSWEVGKRPKPVRWEPWCQAVSKISSLHHIGSLIVTNHGGTDWAQQGSRKIDNFSQASKIHERGGGPVTPLLSCSMALSLPPRAEISGVIFFFLRVEYICVVNAGLTLQADPQPRAERSPRTACCKLTLNVMNALKGCKACRMCSETRRAD